MSGLRFDMGDSVLEVAGWDQLDGLDDATRAKMLQANVDHASMYRMAFATDAGKRVLDDLAAQYLKTRIARPGDDMLAVGIRQGQADVVMRILYMIEFAIRGGAPRTDGG